MGETITKVIACDLDDTLSQTNSSVAAWHNERYGTSMTLDDFHYYHYWKNEGWGTPDETMSKLAEFYQSDSWRDMDPVPGAKEGLERLISKGYSISVVTARGDNQREATEEYLAKWFPGLIDKIHFTGEFVGDKHGNSDKTTKYEVCQSISAVALIDDNLNHVVSCSAGRPPVPTVLFGEYEWNKRLSSVASELDQMGYEQRLLAEKGVEWWKEDELHELPLLVKRSSSWADVETVLDHVLSVSDSI